MEKVILYGAGDYALRKLEGIEKKYDVAMFVDSSVQVGKQKTFEDYKVYNPSILEETQFDYVILLSHKWYEMYLFLLSTNIKEEKIIFGNTLFPALDKVEENIIRNEITIESKGRSLLIHTRNEDFKCKSEDEYRNWCRSIIKDPVCEAIKEMSVKPLSRRFGGEYGKAIDRVYIEKFISSNKCYIKGTVMEIAEPKYCSLFGIKVSDIKILHVDGWGDNVIKGNFETGEGIEENSVDCLIFTQTLLCIYDIKKTIANIYRCLKRGGTALITIPGITQISLYDYRNWGQYWAFTEQCARKLFEEYFQKDKVVTEVYGNVKTAMGFLYGIPAEELTEEDYCVNDEQYQVIIGVRVTK